MKVIWWIIIILVVIGGIFYFMNQSQTETPNTEAPAEGQDSFNTAAVGASDQQSLQDLLAAGTAQSCTFAQTAEGGSNEGVVYIGEGKMRGDFKATANGQTINAHTIGDGKDLYTWMESLNLGFKLAMGQTQSATGQNQSLDLNAKLNYNCSPWTVDAAKFSLPKGVQFTAMGGAMMPVVAP